MIITGAAIIGVGRTECASIPVTVIGAAIAVVSWRVPAIPAAIISGGITVIGAVSVGWAISIAPSRAIGVSARSKTPNQRSGN